MFPPLVARAGSVPGYLSQGSRVAPKISVDLPANSAPKFRPHHAALTFHSNVKVVHAGQNESSVCSYI